MFVSLQPLFGRTSLKQFEVAIERCDRSEASLVCQQEHAWGGICLESLCRVFYAQAVDHFTERETYFLFHGPLYVFTVGAKPDGKVINGEIVIQIDALPIHQLIDVLA